MADKQLLHNLVNSQIDQNDEQGRVEFHNYVQQKMKDVLGIELPAVDTNKQENDEE